MEILGKTENERTHASAIVGTVGCETRSTWINWLFAVHTSRGRWTRTCVTLRYRGVRSAGSAIDTEAWIDGARIRGVVCGITESAGEIRRTETTDSICEKVLSTGSIIGTWV